jgi:hypothetical protein
VDADLIAAVEGCRKDSPARCSMCSGRSRCRRAILLDHEGHPGGHVGGMHAERDKAVAKLFVENLGRFLDGKPLLAVVDRAAGY